MLYVPGKFAFVHVPRTGGISICNTVRANLHRFGPDTVEIGRWLRRHPRAVDMQNVIEEWSDIFSFGLMRNPFELFESNWRETQAWHRDQLAAIAAGHYKPPPWVQERIQVMGRLLAAGFSAYVREHFEYLRNPKGFYQNAFCGPETRRQLVAEVIQLKSTDELPAAWPAIWAKLGPLEVDPIPQLARDNHFAAGRPAVWNRGLIRFVRELCCDDFRRFGFGFPEHLARE